MKHIIQLNQTELRVILAKHFIYINPEDIIDVIVVKDDAPKEEPISKPWYPDDSGEWVEVDPESMSIPSDLDAIAKSDRKHDVWYVSV